jgi:hypothetical protein
VNFRGYSISIKKRSITIYTPTADYIFTLTKHKKEAAQDSSQEGRPSSTARDQAGPKDPGESTQSGEKI